MRNATLSLFLAFCCTNCTEATKTHPQSPTPQTLRGYYVLGDKVSMLRNCADNKQYWVKDATRSLDSLYRQACFPAPIPYEAAYAVLTGTLGAQDSAGIAAETDGTFTVTKVDTLESKNMFNACMPWEFWCRGTEPFWSIQISEAEGGIFLKNMADETGTQYAWAEPRTDGNTSWVYETDGNERPLKIVVKKGKCSDGMSDIEFGYSVEVTVGKETLRGCAVRRGEPIPRPNN